MINQVQHITIRIVASIIHDDALHGVTIDYMGARFTAPADSLVKRVDARMALFELEATIIRSTGRASFLVAYAGHALRVHVQQMQECEVRI